MPVTILGTGQTPYNMTSYPVLPAGVNRFFIVTKGYATPVGQGTPNFTAMTVTYNGVNVPRLNYVYTGEYARGGYAITFGMMIPDNWNAGTYTMVTNDGILRNCPYAFYGNVASYDPTFIGFDGHTGNPTTIGAIAKACDPSGGLYFITLGIENDDEGTYALGGSNITTLLSGNNNYVGHILKTGGTQTTTFTSGPRTNSAAGLIGTLRAASNGGSQSIWWFKKWWKENKNKPKILIPDLVTI